MRQQRVEDPILLCSFLLDGIEINRLQEKVNACARAGNDLPLIGGDA